MGELINILTRTHRPAYFKALQQSIMSQTYKDINWVVGSDLDRCDYYPEAIKLFKPQLILNNIQPPLAPAPYNHYLDIMQETVKEGYVMYLDDDDFFTSTASLEAIADNVREDSLLIWKVRIKGEWIVPTYHSFGKRIQAGDISGIGYCFHSKYLPVEWGYTTYGDYRVAKQLESKGLKIKWLDMVLTRTQAGAHGGK